MSGENEKGDGLDGYADEGGTVAVALLVALLLLAASVMVWFGVATVEGAPAPVYREPPPLHKRIEGGWNLDWTNGSGVCYLSPQGFWSCTMGGTTWHGEWSLDGNVLTICEKRIDSPDAMQLTWKVTLDPAPQPRGGAVGEVSGGTFRLRPDFARHR